MYRIRDWAAFGLLGRSPRLALVVGLVFCPLAPTAEARPAEPAPLPGVARALDGCDRDRVVVIAHRGTGPGTRSLDGRTFSENTIPAFVKAMEAGAEGFEADFWPTSDQRIATHHDPTLGRMTDGTGRIGLRTWAQVTTLRNDSGSAVPSFETVARVMSSYGGHRQQEIKDGDAFSDEFLERMVDIDLDHVADAHNKVLFTSSEPQTLRRIKVIDHRIPVGLIDRSQGGRPAISELSEWLDVILVSLPAADAAYVRQAETAGYEVSVRDVNTPRQLREAVGMGATRVVTDRPELLGRGC